MAAHELDNPFWASLQTRHRDIAEVLGGLQRFPAAFAPFLAVAAAGEEVDDALAALLPAGETGYWLGVLPRISQGWQLQRFDPLAQMICDVRLPVPDGPQVIELGETHRADVLALTALVYPHYFRTRTMELGRYFGIYQDGRLAAMIGERLGTEAHQEISAICTHPDFNGRGYARRLLALLNNDILDHGLAPFLHVSYANTRAKRLYEQMGYRTRYDIAFCSLQRQP